MPITLSPHPLLDPVAFVTRYPEPLGKMPTPPAVLAYFGTETTAPLQTNPEVKVAVRELLRHGGFKPTGRNKPASEYLIKAVEKGWFGPDKGINLAVDMCNVVSLRSGLPISVVDADRAKPPWRIAVTPPDTSYPFNPAGQVIDIGGLLALHDGLGPCGGPVKDSQRTKTDEQTRTTLSIIWGTRALPGRAAEARDWYLELCKASGLRSEDVSFER